MKKIEQIAIGTYDPSALIEALSALGIDEWVHDEVEAAGFVHGQPASNKAELHFNYQLGFELEVLKYHHGLNWHQWLTQNGKHSPNFLSHLGFHVTREEMESIEAKMLGLGFTKAQEVKTTSHTNPAIRDTRRYHYIVFNSRRRLGFDLKLIRRMEDNEWKEEEEL